MRVANKVDWQCFVEWTKKPKKNFFSFLLCCCKLKKKKPVEEEFNEKQIQTEHISEKEQAVLEQSHIEEPEPKHQQHEEEEEEVVEEEEEATIEEHDSNVSHSVLNFDVCSSLCDIRYHIY